MKQSTLHLVVGLAFAVCVAGSSASAQNLLTNNAGFEMNTAYYTPGWGFPQGAPDVLPGWIITLDPTGDGYAGAAANQSPENVEGTHFGYIYSGTGASGVLETAPESRAPVEKDNTYTLWFLARGDVSWSDASLTVSLVWHPNRINDAITGDPTNLNLTLPALVSANDPMQAFHITAVAPPGAHYAGVRITRPSYNYAAAIVDDFVIMADPTDVSLSIEKQGPAAKLSWSRSQKYRLEGSSNPGLSNSWSVVDKPTKGIGSKNHVDYPMLEAVRFFRLTKTD